MLSRNSVVKIKDNKKERASQTAEGLFGYPTEKSDLLHLLHDGLEGLGIVHGQVGEHLAVDLDTRLGEFAHEDAVTHALQTSSSIDTLNPQTAEIALLVAAVTIGIGQTLLPGVLCYCPNILAGSKVAAGKLQNSLTLCS